jgi:PTH1 family peptidyl-tRNA hydrolase
VVGLGNPGPQYTLTRHNAGFILADVLREQWELPRFRRAGTALVTDGRRRRRAVALVKPQTFMNLSGDVVAPLARELALNPAEDLLVLVDEVALPLGSFRIRAGGSAGGHNGLKSVEEALGTIEYGRLRIGVGPQPETADARTDFVLGDFTDQERDVLSDLLPTLVDAVECWLTEGIQSAMNRFNRRGTAE